MNRIFYRTAASALAVLMICTAAGCGKNAESGSGSDSGSGSESEGYIEDLSSFDTRIWGEQTYEEILTLIRDGMNNGWSGCSPQTAGLGDFAKQQGMEIGYLITDLDKNDYQELILAKKSETDSEYRVCTIYTIMEDGSLKVVYRGNDNTEAQILKKNVILVSASENEPAVSNAESGEESGTAASDAEETEINEGNDTIVLSREDWESIMYMTDSEAAVMQGYLVSEAGLSEADAESVIQAVRQQDKTLIPEDLEFTYNQSVAVAYQAACEDGPFDCEIPEDVKNEIAQETEEEQETESDTEEEAETFSDGSLGEGAWLYADGSVTETSVPDKISVQDLPFRSVTESEEA